MKSTKFIYAFILKALVVYVLWFLLYEQWLIKVGWLDDFIIFNLIDSAGFLVEMVGLDYFSYDKAIGVDGSHGVYIGLPCDGIDLMALFSGFIIIFPGNWKDKVWYIPVGIIAIHAMNILRVFALVLIEHYYLEMLEFNHKYTFTIILYVFVFLGWLIWVQKFSRKTA